MKPIVRTPNAAMLFLASVAVSCAAAAAPPAPLKLTVVIDRKEYLAWEPMIADCSLTNIGKDAIDLRKLGTGLHLWFDVTGRDGRAVEPVRGRNSQFLQLSDSGDEPLLRPGRTLRAWADISAFFRWNPPGEYRLQVSHAAPDGYRLPGFAREPARAETVVRISFPAAGSEEAKVAALIAKAWDDDNDVPLRRDGDLRRSILAETKSARFHAAARFYAAQREMTELWAAPPGIVAQEGGDEYVRTAKELVADPLRGVVKGDGSSYLKGLAGWRLLIVRMAFEPPFSREEAAKEAERLAGEHKDTVIGARAEELRRLLKDDRTTLLRELSRKVEWQ